MTVYENLAGIGRSNARGGVSAGEINTCSKEQLRRIALRHQKEGRKDEELTVRRIIDEVFEPTLNWLEAKQHHE